MIYSMKSAIDATLCLAAATFLIIMLVPFTMAQDPTAEEPQRVVCNEFYGLNRKRCESGELTRDTGLSLENAAEDSMDRDERELRRAEIGDDVYYLKGVAGYLARASQSDDLDLKALATATGQIMKRATRLRSRLALPRSEPGAAIGELELPTDRPQLRLEIYSLSSMIGEAVQNPLLTGRMLDVIGSAKARSDLDEIVELSGRIRTQCKFFDKTGP